MNNWNCHVNSIARVTLLTIAMLVAMAASAVPAKRAKTMLQQPDGTLIEAVLCGDEGHKFYTDTEGNVLVEGTSGFYRKATVWEAESMRADWQRQLTQRKAKYSERLKTRTMLKASAYGTRAVDTKRALVILVNFLNLSMKTPDAKSAFDAQFNEAGYNRNSHVGSVRDYFRDQSYGQFDIAFDVVGPVNLDKDFAYYGANDGLGNDKNPGEMVYEACVLIKDSVDFSDYDWDGDGEVDQVFIIYAGYGENSGAAKTTIWPHSWALDSARQGKPELILNGVKVNCYATSCELAGTEGEQIDGIGTACHEYSHCLGLPDTYDINYGTDSRFESGMVMWDIMDSGCYNGPSESGEVPCGYTAYERQMLGWLDFTELEEACEVTDLPSLQDEPVAYVIYNDSNRNEFFTLENRQSVKWFSFAITYEAPHGMLVMHVDYDEDVWYNNEVNIVEGHRRVHFVPSAGEYQSLNVFFPGISNITEFTDDSHAEVGGRLFNCNTDGTFFLHKPIYNIREDNGLISFTFRNDVVGITEMPSVADTHYYTIGGVHTAAPVDGINIVRKGNKTFKVRY